MEQIAVTLGRRIALLRRQKGLTQEALAEQLGISAQAVSKWENDQSCPDIGLLPQLANILGISVDTLLKGEQKQSEPSVRLLPPEERKALNDMMLRVLVDSHDGDRVRVNLPMARVQAALEMGTQLPQFEGSTALKSIDLAQIVELVRHGAVGNLVEIESADGDTVRVFVE